MSKEGRKRRKAERGKREGTLVLYNRHHAHTEDIPAASEGVVSVEKERERGNGRERDARFLAKDVPICRVKVDGNTAVDFFEEESADGCRKNNRNASVRWKS